MLSTLYNINFPSDANEAPFTLAKKWHGTGEKWHGAGFFLARHDSFTLTFSSNFNSKFVSQGNGTARAILAPSFFRPVNINEVCAHIKYFVCAIQAFIVFIDQ